MQEEYLPLTQAAEYVGVSRVKFGNLVKDGAISYTLSQLDKRVKLFKRADLDRLKNEPRPMPQGAAPRSE
jgi:hypothetical protein